MKKVFFAASFLTSLLFAELTPIAPISKLNETDYFNRRFIPYVKLGPQLSAVDAKAKLMPTVGFGFRSETLLSGVDISFSFSQGKTNGDHSTRVIHPRLVYIRFLAPLAPETFYYGFGGSWGTINSKGNTFSGLIGNLDLGYELQRNSNIRQMIDLDISQPALPFYSKGNTFLPILELSYSLGF